MRAFRWLQILVACWLVAALWWSSDGGVAVFELLIVSYGAVALIAAALVIAIVERKRQRSFPTSGLLSVIAIVLAGGVLFFSSIPFRVRFEVGVRSLERFAAGLPVGHSQNRLKRRVGVFNIAESEVLPDRTVRLILAEDMFDESGVAYSPGTPPVVAEDSYQHIRGNWWRWYRSW
jgi:hypothetical protein